MKLKINDYYKTRDNRIAQVVEYDHELGKWPYYGYINDVCVNSWDETGSAGDGTIHHDDLVEHLTKEDYPELYL